MLTIPIINDIIIEKHLYLIKGCIVMSKKVIYVDFKTASKKNHSNHNSKNDEMQIVSHKKPNMGTFLSMLKNLIYRFKSKKSCKNSSIKYKYWL